MIDAPEEGDYDFIMYIQIEEIRMLYDHVCYSIQMWPGSPARPAEEQEYLVQLKNRLFAMLADYNFSNIDV